MNPLACNLGPNTLAALFGVVFGLSQTPTFANPKTDARTIQSSSGVSGGVVAHVGAPDSELLEALRELGAYTAQGLVPDGEVLSVARAQATDSEAYGQLSLIEWEGGDLPYVDDFVNLLILEDRDLVSQSEMARTLRPLGVAMIRDGDQWERWQKPERSTIDDWTHYFHNPTGNAVAQDKEVGPPRHLQWVGSPRWSRHHDRMASMSALVSSQGRLFYIMDEGSRVSIQLPSDWKLIARDAFNGAILWKRPISKWHSQLWPLKSGPTQLARRLVADDGAVFSTLSIDGPAERINPDTGETEAIFEDSTGTEEILYSEGVVFLLVNRGESELEDYGPKFNVGDQARVRTEFVWNEQPREILAADAETGALLWRKESKVAPLTMAVKDSRLLFHDGDRVIALDRTTGEEKWRGVEATRRALIPFNFAPRLVLYESVALFAGGDGKMTAYDLESGRQLWDATHDRSGYQSPQDLLVVGGKVWSAPLTSGRDSGVFTGRNPLTGEIEAQFGPDEDTYWFHHRCYISKATEQFIMSSRTGIEFIDHGAEDWRINHWVRGGCLYGIMPANGLTYAPPHNCACYPEAKLYGLNALASKTSLDGLDPNQPAPNRLIQGPAYDAPIELSSSDWPTYRGDNRRSGYSETPVGEEIAKRWSSKLGGRLSALTMTDDAILVAQIDRHTVNALDRSNGEIRWTFTAGGRVDSPPTFSEGRVVFGSADGWVYCLRAADGALIWKFRAAPFDRRLMSFEQIESVWPVHGSVLVDDGVASFIAGRSIFLDGGIRFIRLNIETGEPLVDTVIDDRDPETGSDIQDRLQTLQMPVGLSDILTSDGKHTYLRSQKILPDGTREDIGPVSGQAALHGGAQQGEGAHLFAPMGFLDGTWFHRSYWVYGKNFAGGHNGYYQAGKYTPSGRILVHDDENVFGFGREPKYLRWTTPLEHQLFSASVVAPDVDPAVNNRNRPTGPIVTFPIVDTLNPADKPITVQAWVFPDGKNGVIAAHGGPVNGYALRLGQGRVSFLVRGDSKLGAIRSDDALESGWNFIAGVLDTDKSMKLYLNGNLVAEGIAPSLLTSLPAQSLDLGADSGSSVGEYNSPSRFTGLIDEFKVSFRAVGPEEIKATFADPKVARAALDHAVVVCDFDAGSARDMSGLNHHGETIDVAKGRGKLGSALWFRKARAGEQAQQLRRDSYVDFKWTRRLPFFASAMALADETLIVAGPPDYLDEDESFQKIIDEDPEIVPLLLKQEAALGGADGGALWTFSKTNGETLTQIQTDALPVWDGMAVSRGEIFIADEQGAITCYAGNGSDQ